MSRAAVVDEIGEPETCQVAGETEQCRGNAETCGTTDHERCDCFLSFDVATDALLSAYWFCDRCLG